MVNFWNQTVKHKLQKLGLESYVIDFVLCIPERYLPWSFNIEDLDDEDAHLITVKIVELNPFHAHTSACHFSWKKDRDLILNGPFQFWVKETPCESLDECVTCIWSPIVLKMYESKYRLGRIHTIFFGIVFLFLVVIGYILYIILRSPSF
jgi:hypothetical protein